jgi:hypothetical protein
MKRRSCNWIAAAFLAIAACVSFETSGIAVPDITGTYAATIALTATNEFETRVDTLDAMLRLRRGAGAGEFVGGYTIAPADSGPLGGLLMTDGTVWLLTFGLEPRPIAGVSSIRALYAWCDFTRLGAGLTRGTFSGDTLRASVQGSLPCLYQEAGTTLTVHTELLMDLTAVRNITP